MAGLVPAIHVFHRCRMKCEYVHILTNRKPNIWYWFQTWKIRNILANNPEWDDLFDMLA